MNTHEYEVVVVGGGPAGLQAGLTLGRMHHSALLLDSGNYRNAPATHLHNFATQDGTPPAEFRAAARRDIAAYDTVTVREVAATSVKQDGEGFLVELDGGESVTARRIILATGLRDTVPDKPGLAELFGTVAAHCPYCHGHEFAGMHVGILGSAPHVAMLALLVSRIASHITVFADGGQLDDQSAAILSRAGVAVRPEPVTGFCRSAVGARVTFDQGGDEEVGGMFVSTSLEQSAPFAEQLGLTMLASGCVEVDLFGRTSLPGVYAAGDLAHHSSLPMPLASVLNAASAGMLAATAGDQDEVAAFLENAASV